MSEHVNINVDWAEADESCLVNGRGTVDVTAAQHTGRVSRHGEAVVTIGSQSKTVQIDQEGKGAFIMFDQESFSIGSEGGFVTLTGKANTAGIGFLAQGSVTIPSYFSMKTADGEVHPYLNTQYQLFSSDPGAINEYSFTIVVQVGRNDTGSEVSHEVLCRESDGTQGSVSIVQEAGGGPGPGEDYIYFQNPSIIVDCSEQSVNLFLNSNNHWVINIY